MSSTSPFQKPFSPAKKEEPKPREASSPFARPQTASPTQQRPQPFASTPQTPQKPSPFANKTEEPRKPFQAFQRTAGSVGQSGAAASQPSPFSTTRAKTAQPASSPLSAPRTGTCGLRPTQSQTTSSTARPTSTFQRTAPSFRTTASTGAQSAVPSFRTQRPPLHVTTPGLAKESTITDEEFTLLRDFIYKKCGIFIAENRKYLIENRLAGRIKTLNLKSYAEYYKYLKFDDNREAELNELYVLMTTNETSFFRNPPQLKVFQEIVLTGLVNSLRQSGQKRLRIWSAGCSTGEEPYTLAIIIAEVLKNELASWDVKITANDLSTQVLAAARMGIYSEYSLRTTPKEHIAKYFTKDGQVYKIKPEMKRLVNFDQINLNEREQLKRVEQSHIVFCRNVIIYFDDDMKRRVINAFYDNLQPGGALLIGHSETLHNICRSFKLEHYAGTIVYRKQA